MKSRPTIVTNMAFWQSPIWQQRVDSIYGCSGQPGDPAPRPWWRDALSLYMKRSRYDVVVTMGARESLAYGLLCALTACSSKQVMTEVFIDSPRTGNPLWRFKTTLFRWVSRRSLGILTNSSAEMTSISERFHVPKAALRYVPLHGTIHEPELVETDAGFVLAAGRTLRDYPTLLRAARQIPFPIRIICGAEDLVGVDLPGNVTVLREVDRKTYLQAVRACTLMVVPLIETQRSTGQVVALEAMGYGKAVVATSAPGTEDWIRHEKNGLLVEAANPDLLAEAVNRLLGDPTLRRQIGQAALEDVASKATFDRHATAKLDAIEALWRCSCA